MSPNRRVTIVSLSLAGAAIAARFVYLARRPFWFDEIFTLWISRRSASRIVEALLLDSGPPLFYVLSHPFVRIGESVGCDAVARVLSLAALAALFLIALSRRASAGPRFIALLAASPLLFFYSGEARAYGLLSALSFLLFLATCRMRGRAALGLAALAAALLPWTHYLGVFIVVSSIALSGAKRRWRSASLQAAALLPFLLWLPIALRQPAAALSWSEEGWLGSLRGTLGTFAFWSPSAPYFSRFVPPAAWAGALAGAAMLAAAGLVGRRRSAVREALTFAIVPLVLAAVAGLVRPIYFSGRTEMAVLPVALWAFARASRRSSLLRVLTTASAAAGTVAIFATLLRMPVDPPYAVTSTFVAATARPGDLVVASDADYLPLRYFADRGALSGRLIGIPGSIERHPGWFEPGKSGAPATEISRLGEAIAALGSGHHVFIAVPPDPAARNIVLPFVAGRRVGIARPPGGDSVLVLDR